MKQKAGAKAPGQSTMAKPPKTEQEHAAEWRAEQRAAKKRDDEDLASEILSLKGAAQTLLRNAGILSDADFYATLDEAFDVLEKTPGDEPPSAGYASLSERQRSAMLYQLALFDLDRHRWDGSPMLAIARAAAKLTWWAIDGSTAALEKLNQRSKQPRDAARADRPAARDIDHDRVRAEFQRIVSGGRSEADARSTLVSRGYGSKPQIWRITTGNTKKK